MLREGSPHYAMHITSNAMKRHKANLYALRLDLLEARKGSRETLPQHAGSIHLEGRGGEGRGGEGRGGEGRGGGGEVRGGEGRGGRGREELWLTVSVL